MPGATNLRDCAVLESLVKKQATDSMCFTCSGAWAMGCAEGLESKLANHLLQFHSQQ